jgi:hypothetical protein
MHYCTVKSKPPLVGRIRVINTSRGHHTFVDSIDSSIWKKKTDTLTRSKIRAFQTAAGRRDDDDLEASFINKNNEMKKYCMMIFQYYYHEQ